MQYIVIRSFYEGNTLHEDGSVFEHSDQAYIDKCLADGNIKPADAAAPSAAPANDLDPQQDPAAAQGAPATDAPLAPPAPAPANHQPTPEEIAATLASTGNGSELESGV